MNRALLFGVTLFLSFGLLPVGHNLLVYIETLYERPTTLPQKIDGVIVLGGGFNAELATMTNMMSTNTGLSRVLDFVALGLKYPKAKLVYAGGSGSIRYPEMGEAPVAKQFLKLSALNEGRVIYERTSRNTFENAINSKNIINPNEGEVWILITSASHIPRSMGVFNKVGWNVVAYPSSPKTNLKYQFIPDSFDVYHSYSLLNAAAKEIIGCVTYYFSGKSAFILPPAALKSQE